MSDLRHEVDEIGRRIWPDPPAAYRSMQARRRRWWLALLQPRRPQVGMRWLPLLAAVATVAIFVTLAGARPVIERTVHPGTPAVQATPVAPGTPEGRVDTVPAPGRSYAIAPTTRPAPPPPPAANPPGTGSAGNAGSSASARSPQSTSSGGNGGVVTVTLTQDDSGTTITVSPGTRIVVTLSAAPHRQWSAPRSLDSAVLTASESARDAGGGAHGTFVASKPGRTRLVAGQGGCHGPLCLIASTSTWQVRVVVRGS